MIPRCNVCTPLHPDTLHIIFSSSLLCQNHFLRLARCYYLGLPPFFVFNYFTSLPYAGPCLSMVQQAGLWYYLGVFYRLFSYYFLLVFSTIPIPLFSNFEYGLRLTYTALERVKFYYSSTIEYFWFTDTGRFFFSSIAVMELGWVRR